MTKKQVVEVLVEGGKATPGPPLGPAIGPLGLNVKQVVDRINEATKDFVGMQVPVKIIVDPVTRQFEIEVGTPPVSQLIKKELGLEKGSSEPVRTIVGNLTMEQVIKIARAKKQQMLAADLKAAAKEVIGTALSMGVTVEGKDPREVQKEIDEGVYDEVFAKAE
ncbi:MAG: large subunit ribosomal protein [Thermococcaceae archaeon]|jgi:large subunit ribosomal protein L11|uniref:50S ribosomal protein L11 n=1 Tax=Thermococcus bergensis TaxID=2689387 RepID=UPI001CEC3559|nr:50S ribosomal protein L11 [Thermococcus bergensis]MCA6213153.1 50S ribosomal protein L11 [Thermococcus bergensis]MDK2783264.1 large subunit ribosomal protein [Thermococcaceae archaeon]MDK2984056.1 large subunit ribosomal protein [Thermococcaceae archaeon]MDN5321121.1 large subunit ribosomal protein [Thermococcaceae archaeon]